MDSITKETIDDAAHLLSNNSLNTYFYVINSSDTEMAKYFGMVEGRDFILSKKIEL